MAYRAAIGQGDTDNAADCRAAYNHLSSKYGASNIATVGFSKTSDVPLTKRAGVSNFRVAKDYDVLYWSSHGSPVPALNVSDPDLYFESGTNAFNYWRNTSNKLKVSIFAACYQFDGTTNRRRWANNIMRKSDIRVMCGYHGSAPGTSKDTSIVNKFFENINKGTTGNSVMYSWKIANVDNSTSTYLVLVYYGEGRQYYRLPGFSSKTYPDPDKNTTSIYRYSSANPDGAIVTSTKSIECGTVPYTIEITDSNCKTISNRENLSTFSCHLDAKTGSEFFEARENSSEEVRSAIARKYNSDFISMIVNDEIRNSAVIREYDDAMAEIPIEGTEEIEHIIGSTTQLFGNYNGIIMEGNCIASVSDAKGVIALTNQWNKTSIVQNVDHVDLLHSEKASIEKALMQQGDNEEAGGSRIGRVRPVYIRKGQQYVLHYELSLENGQTMSVDAKDLERKLK